MSLVNQQIIHLFMGNVSMKSMYKLLERHFLAKACPSSLKIMPGLTPGSGGVPKEATPPRWTQGARAWHKVKVLSALALLAANSHQSGLSNEVLHDFLPQGFWSCNLSNLKRLDFSQFTLQTWSQLWQHVTSKALVIGKYSIPHLKTLINGCLEPEVQGRDSTFTLCHILSFRMENLVWPFVSLSTISEEELPRNNWGMNYPVTFDDGSTYCIATM